MRLAHVEYVDIQSDGIQKFQRAGAFFDRWEQKISAGNDDSVAGLTSHKEQFTVSAFVPNRLEFVVSVAVAAAEFQM